MLIIHTIPEAIGLMMVGIVLLGTWPAVWNLIEQHGRIPSHIFLDYALTYLVIGSTVALTLGQLGPEQPNFLEQLQQDNGSMVAFAFAGGFCLALGDLAMQYATALLGLSIGPPLLNALTVIIGVVLAYFIDGGINKPQLVFTGMACASLAIALGAAAHIVSQRRQTQLNQQQSSNTGGSSSGSRQVEQVQVAAAAAAAGRVDIPFDDSARHQPSHAANISGRADSSATAAAAAAKIGRPEDIKDFLQHEVLGDSALVAVDVRQMSMQPSDCCQEQHQLKPNTADMQHRHQQQQQHLQQQGIACDRPAVTLHIASSSPDCGVQQQDEAATKLQRQRSIQLGENHKYLGLAIAVAGGVVYGLFLPAFQIAANDPFKLLPAGTPPLTVYTTNFYFSIGFTVTSVVISITFLYRPPFGTKASSLKRYLLDHRGRGLSIASGALAAFGDLTQFIGGQTAGYAACMLVMAYPVVGVLWGMLRFKEFKQGSKAILLLVVGQVVCYSAAVGLLAASAELRSSSH